MRIAKAWGIFWAYKHLLVCKLAKWKDKLRVLKTTVENSLLWGSGSWHVTVNQCSRLRGVQRKMIGIMAREEPRKMKEHKPNEPTYFYFPRRANHINWIMERYEVQSWDVTVKRNVFNFAGHVSRMGQYDSDRLVHQALQWKNRKWLKTVEE